MKNLYHVSFNDSLPSVLTPRQPDGSELVSDKVEDLPDRVSFAPTIRQCLLAIEPNIRSIIKQSVRYGGFSIWLYRGLPDKKTKFIPDELVKKKVLDAKLTGEICVVTPIRIERVGEVFVKTKIVNGKPTIMDSQLKE